MPEVRGYSHMALTVTNVERSTEWWSTLLGIQTLMRGDENGIRFTVNLSPSGLIMGFRQHAAGGTDDRFTETRVGLDHFALHVESRVELEAWGAKLDELGIAHSGIKDVDYGSIITFRDPDNIQAEFFAMPGT